MYCSGGYLYAHQHSIAGAPWKKPKNTNNI
jgi:hypothetical protein